MEIEFSLLENYANIEHKPVPASQMYPSWFKSLPATTPEGMSTLKRCPPMTDMFSLGYIIPMWTEIKMTPTSQGYHIDTRMPIIENPLEGSRQTLSAQYPQQYQNTPWQDYQVIKLSSPWVVKTPPGYSLMILPLFGQHGCPVEPISAIIEADEYQIALSITCKIVANQGEVVHLLPGMPLAQLVPFKRETWTSKYSIKSLVEHAKIANKLRTYITSGYRRFWHKKKEFN
jgi:hypothetical protein